MYDEVKNSTIIKSFLSVKPQSVIRPQYVSFLLLWY